MGGITLCGGCNRKLFYGWIMVHLLDILLPAGSELVKIAFEGAIIFAL